MTGSDVPWCRQPSLLTAWRLGRPISYRELRATTGESKATVLRLITDGVLLKTLLSTIRCDIDSEPLLQVERGRVLVCPRCHRIESLDATESLSRYSLSVDVKAVTQLTVEAFEANKFKHLAHGDFVSSAEVTAAGTLQDIEGGSEVELLVAAQEVSGASLLQIWGHCTQARRTVVLVHPGLVKEADDYLRLAFQTSPIYALYGPNLDDPQAFAAAAQFTAFRREIEEKLASVQGAFVVPPSSGAPGDSAEDPHPSDLDELSHFGRASYEPAALRLLSILGPTLPFRRRAGVHQVPDGVLLLPDGFWIVDAKSSESGYRFLQGERDKIKRYIETISRRGDQFANSWKFYGAVIVARTGDLSWRDINNARRDFRTQSGAAVVTIVSHEGLAHLWENTRDSSDYWHRRIFSEDPRDLLLLRSRFLPEISSSDSNRIGPDSPLRVVTAAVIERYWETVSSNRVPLPGWQDPHDVLTRLEEMFIRDYAK